MLKTQNINLYYVLFEFQLNSTIVPTKVLTDPTELDRALSSGIQAVNGFTFDPSTGTFPEAYQVQLKQAISKYDNGTDFLGPKMAFV